jgi:hypothetical protein
VEPHPPAACASAPKWVSQPPCIKDGFLYGAGEFASKVPTYLSRATASNRARKRLALALGAHETDKFTLAGSEIDQIFHCEGATYALARVAHKPTAEFKKCSDGSLAAAPLPEGCPAWTSRLSWKEGGLLYGVAPAFRVMQRHQAETAAVNRARQAATELVGVELQLSHDGVTSVSQPVPLAEKRRSIAECGGTRWMMVAFEQKASDEKLLRAFEKGPRRIEGMKLKKPSQPQ